MLLLQAGLEGPSHLLVATRGRVLVERVARYILCPRGHNSLVPGALGQKRRRGPKWVERRFQALCAWCYGDVGDLGGAPICVDLEELEGRVGERARVHLLGEGGREVGVALDPRRVVGWRYAADLGRGGVHNRPSAARGGGVSATCTDRPHPEGVLAVGEAGILLGGGASDEGLPVE